MFFQATEKVVRLQFNLSAQLDTGVSSSNYPVPPQSETESPYLEGLLYSSPLLPRLVARSTDRLY
ncbi:hypothetical protein PROFUN_03683 [Planoprotostelium fungivorum]|uniref:Uncharacterized protein n=1 Tax=Planoprotostelium fungivorum TaxID=1890364 RepID=A0A2P6NSJ9_9EUKA|nr:hypothetical protein PROFUN_03683 [Planoprotostelium fungivorum]